MAARQQAGERECDFRVLAENDAAQRFLRFVDGSTLRIRAQR